VGPPRTVPAAAAVRRQRPTSLRLGSLLIGLLVLLGIVVPTAPAAGADPIEELRAAREAVENSTARQGELDRAVLAAQSELAATRAELDRLEAELEQVRTELAAATAASDAATARAAGAARSLKETTTRLRTARRDLAAYQRLLADQARHAYKYGAAGRPHLLLQRLTTSTSPAEFGHSLVWLEAVLDQRSDEVRSGEELVEDVTRLQVQAADERLRRDVDQAAAAAARDEVATLEAAQADLVAEAAERHERQDAVLAALELDLELVAGEVAAAQEATEQLMARVADAQRRALAGADVAEGSVFLCPVEGGRFINDWGFPRSGGRTHEGTDVFAPQGTPIVAMADATVTAVSRVDRGLGGLTVSYAVDGYRFYNAHLASVAEDIEVGTRLVAGQEIGTVGTSGNARGTPPHNHFGLYAPGGPAFNPYPLLAVTCAGD
jgi:murein DD-endopeptidase MepM/ murein hydrolase activator NlpD